MSNLNIVYENKFRPTWGFSMYFPEAGEESQLNLCDRSSNIKPSGKLKFISRTNNRDGILSIDRLSRNSRDLEETIKDQLIDPCTNFYYYITPGQIDGVSNPDIPKKEEYIFEYYEYENALPNRVVITILYK